MAECIIEKINDKEYDRYLLCLTFESIINYLPAIEESPDLIGYTGKMLIDQLLVAGNGINRFISCECKSGKIELNTAKNVSPDASFKKRSSKILHDTYKYVENSILTVEQKQLVRLCEIF